MQPPCEICLELNEGIYSPHYALRGIPASGREIMRTGRFVLAPDYAPLVAGHLLLFTMGHALSIADHIAAGSGTADDLDTVFGEYRARYGALTAIEHGSTHEVERDHPCIAHAHLHLFPLDSGPIVEVFSRDGGSQVEMRSWGGMAETARGREYVLVGDGTGVAIAVDWAPPQRQYARSLVGAVLELTPNEIYSDTCLAPDVVMSTLENWRPEDVRQSVE